jgi:hypothetical protein
MQKEQERFQEMVQSCEHAEAQVYTTSQCLLIGWS